MAPILGQLLQLRSVEKSRIPQATPCSSSSLSGTPVLISFTRYRETSPRRCGGVEIQAQKMSSEMPDQKLSSNQQVRELSSKTKARKMSSTVQEREKRRLAQEEIERFEEKFVNPLLLDTSNSNHCRRHWRSESLPQICRKENNTAGLIPICSSPISTFLSPPPSSSSPPPASSSPSPSSSSSSLVLHSFLPSHNSTHTSTNVFVQSEDSVSSVRPKLVTIVPISRQPSFVRNLLTNLGLDSSSPKVFGQTNKQARQKTNHEAVEQKIREKKILTLSELQLRLLQLMKGGGQAERDERKNDEKHWKEKRQKRKKEEKPFARVFRSQTLPSRPANSCCIQVFDNPASQQQHISCVYRNNDTHLDNTSHVSHFSCMYHSNNSCQLRRINNLCKCINRVTVNGHCFHCDRLD